jgi:hypothetical protein
MQTTKLQTGIASPSANLDKFADNVARQPDLLPAVFDGLTADKARVKFGCLKVLRLVSEKNPAVLYPGIDRLFDLLKSENNILKWGAIICIGNLADVDSEGKLDRRLDRFLGPISGPAMITAANIIGAAGKIARARPHLAENIARALLRVERAKYQTAECRNVVVGHAIEALDLFYDRVAKRKPLVDFVQRQLRNRRKAVQRKAARFLKRHAPIASGA